MSRFLDLSASRVRGHEREEKVHVPISHRRQYNENQHIYANALAPYATSVRSQVRAELLPISSSRRRRVKKSRPAPKKYTKNPKLSKLRQQQKIYMEDALTVPLDTELKLTKTTRAGEHLDDNLFKDMTKVVNWTGWADNDILDQYPRVPNRRQRQASIKFSHDPPNNLKGLTYCVHCKRKTINIDMKLIQKSSGHPRLASICGRCGSRKSTFIKRKGSQGFEGGKIA